MKNGYATRTQSLRLAQPKEYGINFMVEQGREGLYILLHDVPNEQLFAGCDDQTSKFLVYPVDNLIERIAMHFATDPRNRVVISGDEDLGKASYADFILNGSSNRNFNRELKTSYFGSVVDPSNFGSVNNLKYTIIDDARRIA